MSPIYVAILLLGGLLIHLSKRRFRHKGVMH